MAAAIPAEEIADDFRHSLEYLQTPDRYTINNFTVIAKENTEHADAISNVLVEHINKAPPHHKLPALYVLDSIAKNIGTPYTLFLGHKLYSVFLNAYSAVDSNTRKKLDEMLKTWKSPVPGSLDPMPVFPLEYTKKIENALIQARTAFLKKHEQSQGQPITQKKPVSTFVTTQWRNTPTPPQQATQYLPPASQSYYPHNTSLISPRPPFQQAGLEAPLTPSGQHAIVQHPSNLYTNNEVMHSPFFQGSGPHGLGSIISPSQGQVTEQAKRSMLFTQSTDLELLQRDIDRLISSCSVDPRGTFAHPQQMSKLDALKALKGLLSSQALPPAQLAVIRRQVDELQTNELTITSNSKNTRPFQPDLNMLNEASSFRHLTTGPTRHAVNESAPNQPAVDLASLLARTSSIPVSHSQDSKIQSNPSLQVSSSSISSLLASLAQEGVLSQPMPPEDVGSMKPAELGPRASVADLLARATGSMSAQNVNILFMSSASLKIARPDLLKAMIEKRPNQCVNCGLRFASSDDGKARKELHMDWHFKANQRIADTSRGIQSRSWFVGDLEWMKFKEIEDQLEVNVATHGRSSTSSTTKPSKSAFVSVPSDQDAYQPCPICQERFVTGFNHDIQDWVWLDATQVGSKIYHASCYADLCRDGHNARERTATPDSVLGKRKAEARLTLPQRKGHF